MITILSQLCVCVLCFFFFFPSLYRCCRCLSTEWPLCWPAGTGGWVMESGSQSGVLQATWQTHCKTTGCYLWWAFEIQYFLFLCICCRFISFADSFGQYRRYFLIVPCRADPDGVTSHPNPDSDVRGVQERYGGGATAWLGLCGPDLPLFGFLAALSQKPFWGITRKATGWNPTGQPSKLFYQPDWRCPASAGWWKMQFYP